MSLKTTWIFGRLKRLLPCFLLIGISLIGYWFTGQTTPVKIPSSHLKSPSGRTEATPPKLAPTADPATQRWVVVVGRRASCNALALVFADWTVLIVDGHTAQYRHSRCVVLDQAAIDKSSSQLHLSDEQPSRLLAAYLYAIQHGASVIRPVTVSDDGSTLQPRKHTARVGPQTGLVLTSSDTIFDAAAHFGCNRTSRGMHAPSDLGYSLCRHRPAAIQSTTACAGAMASDPSTSRPVCDVHAPSVTLAHGRFIPLHLGDATFTRDAFWALPAALVADSDERLTWSLFVQRLLWLTANQVVVQACRTGLSDKVSSRLLSTAARLNKWKCQATTTRQCIMDLLANNSGLLHESVVSSYTHWFDALEKVGYTFPRLNDSFNEACEKVILHAVDQAGHRTHLGSPGTNIVAMEKLYNDTCHQYNKQLPKYTHINFAQPWTQFNEVLLIVTFNNPHYEAIPYIETLYRPFFPNILYCGPISIDAQRFPDLNHFRFSFISYGQSPRGHVAGAFNYKCMQTALRLDYAVDGYLAAADDLLLAVHTLSELSTKAVWFRPKKSIRIGEISKLRECKLGMCDFYPHWPWWGDYQNATIKALREIASRTHSSAIMHAAYQRLLSSNGAADRPNGCFADIYYIPSKLSQEFLELVDVFLRHQVFLEIAVPTIIRCLVEPTDVEQLRGVELWDIAGRMEPWKYFKTQSLVGKTYWHPLKWGILAGGSEPYSRLYCAKVLPYLHDRLARSID